MGLSRSIAAKVANYDDPNSFASRLRAKRIAPLLAMVDAAFEEHGAVKILDVGGTRRYWRILPENLLKDKNVTITLVNVPGENVPIDEEHFHYLAADGCNMDQFEDDSFHIAHSNSVVEHVGCWANMQGYAREARRLAPAYFIQTPNFWFPIEPHFMMPFYQFLPNIWRIWLLQHFNLGHRPRERDYSDAVRTVEEVQLLNFKMFRCLFPDAKIIKERLFLMPKSLVAIRYQREE